MRWMVVAAAVLASACSDDTSGPDPIQVEGVYTLQTINGKPLPVNLGNVFGNFFIDQTGGKMTLSTGGAFREEDYLNIRFTDPQTGPVVEPDTTIFTGTWQRQDSVMTLNTTQRIRGGLSESFSEVLFGVINGNRLTLNLQSGDSLFTYVYRRN